MWQTHDVAEWPGGRVLDWPTGRPYIVYCLLLLLLNKVHEDNVMDKMI